MPEPMTSYETEQEDEISTLPPRSEVHKKREGRKKKRHIQYLFIRFLVAVFIVLPIAVYFYIEHYIMVKQNPWNAKFFEEILFEKKGQTDMPSHSEQTGTFIFHKVEEGETLASIAKQYFPYDDGIAILTKYNNIQNGKVMRGQVLKIPAHAN